MVPTALFVTALLVRLLVGGLFPAPAYPDSYYYVNVAQQLAAGNGFTVDYIWSFIDVGGVLPDDPTLPIPSNAHWMPLASLVQVPFIWLLGATPLAFGLPFWIAGAAAAPLTWLVGRDAGLSDAASGAAALMVAVPGGLTVFFSQPDNFGLFVTLGALALWLSARGLRGDRRAFVLGGAVVGLATLSRNDGILLGIPFALAAAADLRRPPASRVGLAAAVGCAALFAFLLAPWLLRQLEVFGTISPSAVSGRILWAPDYVQLHSVSGPLPTPATLLDQGLGSLIESRLNALFIVLLQFAFLPLVVVLAPFAVLGAVLSFRSLTFVPFLIYALVLVGVNAALFAIHVRHGNFLHSVAALLPHTYLLVTIGIGAAVSWVSARRKTWHAPVATRFFMYGALVVIVLGASLGTYRTLAVWERVQSAQRELAAGLQALPPGERLMSIDPGAYHYLADRPGVVTPTDPLPVIEEVMRAYDVRWLALERDQVLSELDPVLRGDLRLAWLSEPVLTVSDLDDGVPRASLHAVCLTPADTRCER